MASQFLQARWLTSRAKIIVRGANDHVERSELSSHMASAVGKGADANSEVYSVLNQVYDMIRKTEVKFQFLILLREIDEDGCDALSAQQKRGTHSENA
jgi:hypothetical protein